MATSGQLLDQALTLYLMRALLFMLGILNSFTRIVFHIPWQVRHFHLCSHFASTTQQSQKIRLIAKVIGVSKRS